MSKKDLSDNEYQSWVCEYIEEVYRIKDLAYEQGRNYEYYKKSEDDLVRRAHQAYNEVLTSKICDKINKSRTALLNLKGISNDNKKQ